MLTPKVQTSLKHAKAYFREHLSAADYYVGNAQVRGEWFGVGAEQLGLKGDVSEAEFLRLCEGWHPHTKARLTARRNSSRRSNGQVVANRRVFYDFTFSPPKSVSVVAFLEDRRLVDLHDQAVAYAMRELEHFAHARVRRAGQCSDRRTGNLVGAAFRHDTSRERDPHLHTHCVVFNATFDRTEERWKALEASAMYRAQKVAEGVYFHELSKGLHRLGYATVASVHNFEIKGVPVAVLDRFSKRHQQIDAETQRRATRGELRGNVKDAREQIARDLRKRKAGGATAERLRAEWLRELNVAERDALGRLRGAGKPERADVAALVSWADDHLFERQAVVEEPALVSAALRRGRGQEFDLATLRAEIARRGYVRDDDGTRLTSCPALRCELELVLAARDGRNAHPALAPDFVPARKLSVEQEQAVTRILTSRDFITLFRGGAGTGKSFALREVRRGLDAAGHPVVVVTPQRQQALDLQRDGLPADTLSQLLARRELPRGAVVLVDEAGQIGGRQLHQLVQLARSHRARLILSGDTRQHGAVTASDALRALESYGQLVPAEVAEIRRQDPARARSASERTDIARYRAAVKAASAGEVATSFGILERLGWVREVGEASRHAAIAREFHAATERGETTLVVAQTWAEVHAVNRAIQSELARTGKLGPAMAVTTFTAVDATVAQKRDPAFYHPEQHAHFVQRYGRFTKGEVCPILGASKKGVAILKDGRRSTVSFRYVERIAVATAQPLNLAPGDRLQLKFNGRSLEGHALANGELVTVRAISAKGSITVVNDQEVVKTLHPAQRVFNLGYAITFYGSQGKTVDTVLLSDAGSHAATNRNQWYVAISRARKRALIVTGDKAALRTQIQRDGARPLALELSSPVHALRRDLDPRAWIRRARTAIATLHRLSFVQQVRARTAVRRHV